MRAGGFASLILIFAAGFFIYCFRLGDSPLDRTEPFRALVADQMVRSGDWLIPRLYGEVYLRKPPLIYWIEAATQKAFGHGDELVWRFPSAVGSALLAVFLAWWAGRWFGSKAVMPTGIACLMLVALWDQNRGADIDALNTVAACVTTVCVLELMCGSGGWRAGWSIGFGAALACTLLLKGPGGLPQILAAVVGSAIAMGSAKQLKRPGPWVGLLIGFGIFAIYVALAKSAMNKAGIAMDQSGGQEVLEKMFLHSWWKWVAAIFMPVTLLLFALPVSLVLPLAGISVTQLKRGDPNRNRAKSILWTLTAGTVIWMLSSNDNPRYEYVMFPLLAPLVGFVWSQTQLWDARRLLIPVCVMLTGATLLLTLKLPKQIPDYRLVWLCAGGSVLVLFSWLASPGPLNRPNGYWSNGFAILLMLLLAVPMAERKNAERRKKSARNAVPEMRMIIGDARRVASVGVVRDMPEIFYYCGVDVDSFGEAGLAALAHKARGEWVVISETPQYPAYSTLLKQIPDAFPRGLKKLHMPDARDHIYVGYYDPPAGANLNIQ